LKIFANFPHDLPQRAEYAVATVGVFDGLHRGHQSILRQAVQEARQQTAALALVTFDPHPRAVLGPPKRARLLSPLEERLELLAQWPVDAVAVLRFDQQVAKMSYVDFVRRILVDGLGGALSVVYEVVMRPESDESHLYSYAWKTQREKMVKSVVQVPIGLLLVFGRQTLAERWSRIRGGL